MEQESPKVSGQLKAYYDGYYDGASEWRRLGAISKTECMLRLCRDQPHEKILEIGCGDGAILQRLSDIGFGSELYGLEISTSGAEITRSRAIPRLLECQIYDGYRVPYENGRFDLVILSHVVEHLEHPARLLQEASRVARLVFVEVPLEDNWLARRGIIPSLPGHINFYTRRSIRETLENAGLRVMGQTVYNLSPAEYRHFYGAKGMIVYLPKEALLRVAPGIATPLMTYNCGTLAQGKTIA